MTLQSYKLSLNKYKRKYNNTENGCMDYCALAL